MVYRGLGNAASQNCGSALKDLFIILHSQRGEEAYES